MNAVPPVIPRRAAGPFWFAGVVVAAAALGAGLVLYFFDPQTHAFYPVCRFHQITGLYCPGCGATRAAHALLHGKLAVALRDNALLVVLPLVLGLRMSWLAMAQGRGRPAASLLSPAMGWSLVAVAAVFTVLRNLPAFGFLRPG